MRPEEIMIGDYLMYEDEPIKVTDIYDYSGVYRINDDNHLLLYIKPIPLTEEILEKNEFVTNNDHTLTGSCIYHRLCGKYEEYKVTVRLLNGWVKIASFDDRWYTLLDLNIQPRYVHELQHILRLCGLNELADNFKV